MNGKLTNTEKEKIKEVGRAMGLDEMINTEKQEKLKKEVKIKNVLSPEERDELISMCLRRLDF